MNPSEVRVQAIRIARSVASARGERLCTTFDASFSGDLARFLVQRRLRRLFPETSSEFIEGVLEEYLTP